MAADMTDPKARADTERIHAALCTASNIHDASTQPLLTPAECHLLTGLRLRLRGRLGRPDALALSTARLISDAAHEIEREASE